MDIKTEFISDWSREKIAQGQAQGRVEGRVEGRAEALPRVLGARGIAVDEAAAQRIGSRTDIALLDAWLVRALGVQTTDELFD